MEPAIWGFVGTLIGAAASIITTVIISGNQVQLQKENNSLERQERARVFQRENLLKIQDTLQDALRFHGQAYLEFLKAYRKDGKWRKVYLPDELDENIRLTNSRLLVLVERVSNDSLRSKLKTVQSNLTAFSLSKSEDEAREKLHQISKDAEQVMEELGKVLRNQY